MGTDIIGGDRHNWWGQIFRGGRTGRKDSQTIGYRQIQRGGDAPDGKILEPTLALQGTALPQTDTEGGTHRTERLTNIDMVGRGVRQTQRGGRTGRKD